MYYNAYSGHILTAYNAVDGKYHIARDCCCGVWPDNPTFDCAGCGDELADLSGIKDVVRLSISGFAGTSRIEGSMWPLTSWHTHSYDLSTLNGYWWAPHSLGPQCIWVNNQAAGPSLVYLMHCGGEDLDTPTDEVDSCWGPRPRDANCYISIEQLESSFLIQAQISYRDWAWLVSPDIFGVTWCREIPGQICSHDWVNDGWPMLLPNVVYETAPETYILPEGYRTPYCQGAWGERFVTGYTRGQCVIDFPPKVPPIPVACKPDWTSLCPWP